MQRGCISAHCHGEIWRAGTCFFATFNARSLMRAGQVVIRNLPVVANVKIALSVQSKKLDKLDYE